MGGIDAVFKNSRILNAFDQLNERAEWKALETLRYLGEEFVNKARLLNTYRDRTGNLRASIGYIILKDGVVVEENFERSNDGSSKGKEVAAKLSDLYPSGFVLIGVAGMEYSRYVEAKGYDVISGSEPEASELKSIWNEISL
ncbi:hypothetical protein [Flavicella sediminum]|uniref:hypothetical protein n=1 Tax=Flavicella sediminum TaxID=2585141 RepID=UPI001AA050FB|nr:hypothetical protein [Flavicella sediminum]